MSTNENELPELETAALEELPVAEPEALTSPLANPFDDPPAAPVHATHDAAPAAPAATTVSAKELTDDILGGVDFDVPAAGAALGGGPKPVAFSPPKLDPKPAPSAGGAFAFKPAVPAFAAGTPLPKPGVPGAPVTPFGASPKPLGVASPLGQAQPAAQPFAAAAPSSFSAPADAAEQGSINPRDMFGDLDDLDKGVPAPSLPAQSAPVANPTAAAPSLAHLLTADVLPAALPADTARLLLQVCRLLVKKGIIDPNEL